MTTFSRLRHNIAAASGVVALSLGALVAATPAQAQASTDRALSFDIAVDPSETAIMPEAQPDNLSQCPAHSLCMWKDIGYQNALWVRTFGTVPSDVFHFVGTDDIGDNFNDQASSLFNNRAWASGVGKDWPVNFNANPVNVKCYLANAQVSDLRGAFWPDNTTMQDSISSFELASGTNPRTCIHQNGTD
jgi:hypothetical protein